MGEVGPAECSVVIPHYGDPRPTIRLVARLREAAEDGAGHEVVVVDDGSPEPLSAVPGARVLRLDANQGFGHAVNVGVRATRHDVVLVLNSDLLPEPGFVDELVAAALPEFPALTAPCVTESGVLVENRTVFPTVWSVVASRSAVPGFRSRTPLPAPQPRTPAGNREVAWVSGAAMCFPRSVFERAGGFDEDFFMYMEDVDLQLRLREQGVRRVLLEGVRVEHVGAASSTDDSRRAWMVDSTFVYFKKRGRSAALVVGWLAMTGANLLYDLARRSTGRQVDVWGSASGQWRLFRSGVAASRRARRAQRVPS